MLLAFDAGSVRCVRFPHRRRDRGGAASGEEACGGAQEVPAKKYGGGKHDVFFYLCSHAAGHLFAAAPSHSIVGPAAWRKLGLRLQKSDRKVPVHAAAIAGA